MLIRNLSHLPLLALLLNVSTLSAQTLFWADLAGRIQKSGTDGAPITTILRSEAPEDLLTSPDGQTLYWSESGNNGIWKYAAGTPAPVKIYQAPETVRGLALDQDNLYFVQPAGIYRMKTDGSLPVVALAVSGANDICLIGGLLYWTGLQDGKIYKQNGLTGTAIFSSLSFPTNLLYNATDDRLYWLEYCGASTCSGIRKGKTDGTGKQIVVDEFISGFALDSAGATLYCTYDIYDEVFTISTTGTGRTSVADITSSPTDIVLFNGRLAWFDRAYGDYLYTAALTGSNQQVLASKSVYRPTRFAADTVQKWLYWVNSPSSFSSDNSAAIKRARFDGSEVQTVVPVSQLDAPYGIWVDMANQKLYWTDQDDNVIRRANTDGSQVQDVVTGLNDPVDLVVDPANNRLFWTDWSAATVMRADLSGGQKTALASNLNQPWGLAYDPAVDSLFFTEYGGRTIQRLSTSGGDRDTLLVINDAFSRPNGLCIDRAANRIYWADDFKPLISRANIDGSNPTTIFVKADGISMPAGIQVFPAGSVVKTTALAALEIEVFPNPFRAVLQIKQTAAGDRAVLFDLLGRPALEQILTGSDLETIDTSALPPGWYVLTIQRAGGGRGAARVLRVE